jgi:hypothetical protein
LQQQHSVEVNKNSVIKNEKYGVKKVRIKGKGKVFPVLN